MQINTNNPQALNDAIHVTVQKKAEDVVQQQMDSLFGGGKMDENTKAVEEAAKATGKGNNLDIQG